MTCRTIILGLLVGGALLPAGASAQSDREVRYPDGTVVQPLPVVPSMPSMSGTGTNLGVGPDVTVTGSTIARVPVAPAASRAESETAGRSGCDLRTYNFGPGERVRVHRC